MVSIYVHYIPELMTDKQIKAKVFIQGQSNIMPLAILPIILENPIMAMEMLASFELIPARPIISGK